jgi:hypothetical protein
VHGSRCVSSCEPTAAQGGRLGRANELQTRDPSLVDTLITCGEISALVPTLGLHGLTSWRTTVKCAGSTSASSSVVSVDAPAMAADGLAKRRLSLQPRVKTSQPLHLLQVCVCPDPGEAKVLSHVMPWGGGGINRGANFGLVADIKRPTTLWVWQLLFHLLTPDSLGSFSGLREERQKVISIRTILSRHWCWVGPHTRSEPQP